MICIDRPDRLVGMVDGMIDIDPVRTVTFSNGLTLRFYDRTNRYFGDFHRVCIQVEGWVNRDSLPAGLLNRSPQGTGVAVYHRQLERMGVTSEQVAATINLLITDFIETTSGYLEHPAVPARLIQDHFSQRRRGRSQSLSPGDRP